MEENNSQIGERLKFALQELRVTNKEIAEIFDTSSQNISNLKNSNKMNDLISRIAVHYGININWILTGKGSFLVDLNNSQINNYQGSNISGIGQNFGESEQTINKSPLCVEIEKMDSSIVAVFVDVYRKMEKEKNLKELFEVLGKLKFS